MAKFTLDRIDNGIYVFLWSEDEGKQLLIPKDTVNHDLREGDIVEITRNGDQYDITLLEEETQDMKDRVSALLEKPKNKK
ncbi:DUF3006 domain-containing protein [Sporosarcina highlanderae]|uniref:DUF3006 domain-containing protein n=1 Tax=Sporosarcina highlanderae TaxID=3035916 RepID=A0ABT8JSW6_9BACL|nr:DUF3006 domain-containing protein [Sporosarcina highlanderae]MDN4607903.1 DUF3006 domain-containing protein [Sporosarcina highlanderae]